MHTELAEFLINTPEGQEAKDMVGRCVHCGFCTATCPTYQLLGDELDSPRGRIYLMKQVLEGQAVTEKTQLHLDRCLSCRNCETTCPSGVEYGRLVDIGRKIVDDQVPRPWTHKLVRTALKEGLTSPLFAPAMKLGQWFRPLLPETLKNKVPAAQDSGTWPQRPHATRVLLLAGCVQPAMLPNINSATARVLDALQIQTLVADKAGCCGAIRYHLNDHAGGLDDMRRNIDAWWPWVEQGVEAIIMNASGCGATVKEYGHKLRHDPQYAERAARISAMTYDVSEYLLSHVARLQNLLSLSKTGSMVFHPPCTLQHGQKMKGVVEDLMTRLGFGVSVPAEGHLCCGSAGTYSVLQPKLAYELRDRKLAAIEQVCPNPDTPVASANIGCITHLQSGTQRQLLHWIELIDAALVDD